MAALTAGCGEFIRSDRAPVTLVILSLQAARGSAPTEFFSSIGSDVAADDGSVFNDLGRVEMAIMLKDPGIPSVVNIPSPINRVTVTRYRVAYRRADGRNQPGVDVPFPFEGAVTFTVPAEGTATSGFELVRNAAKLEPPLSNIRSNRVFITTIADVTFFGHDQAGNATSATGSIEVVFGNFGD
jgi:hypothetical protein